MKLAVNEIFETMQGEASFTGTPAVFVRLQGCSVGCPWCDTKHTWDRPRAMVRPLGDILLKVIESATFAEVTPQELVGVILSFRARHVVITGGEPADYDLFELSELLIAAGRTVQLETSGTSPIRIAELAFVTVSPKIEMPGKRVLIGASLRRANEIKMPVGSVRDIAALREVLGLLDSERAVRAPLVYLQPLSTSEKATKLCVQAATEYGWRVSIQTHKYLGVR